MFGQRPRLLINFVFPTIGSNEAPPREASTRNVDVYVASVRDQLRSVLWLIFVIAIFSYFLLCPPIVIIN